MPGPMPRLCLKMERLRNAAMSPQQEFGNAVACQPVTVTIGYTFAITARGWSAIVSSGSALASAETHDLAPMS